MVKTRLVVFLVNNPITCFAVHLVDNTRKLQFRSKQCVFLGYSNLHKWYKCLDPTKGRVYTSWDVVFDERVFTFASLCPNADARLKAELTLRPNVLHNLNSSFGDAHVHDQHLPSPMPTNMVSSSVEDLVSTRTNPEQTGANSRGNDSYFMCPPRGSSAGADVDLSGSSSALATALASYSTPSLSPGTRMWSSNRCERIFCAISSVTRLSTTACGCTL
jgi:hypothetical protein